MSVLYGPDGMVLPPSGYRNPATGAGYNKDNSQHGFFTMGPEPSRIDLESIYGKSVVAKKLIDIPVNDAFLRWREFIDIESSNINAMTESEEENSVRARISEAYRAARLCGSSLLIIADNINSLDEKLDIDNFSVGQLANLFVVSKYDVKIESYDTDVYSRTFNQPLVYEVNFGESFKNLKDMPELLVHESRVIRFDGITPPLPGGWASQSYNGYFGWGLSELIPALISIIQDAAAAAGVSKLIDEASIPYLKLSEYKQWISGESDPEIADAYAMMSATLAHKSIFDTYIIDKEDEIDRVTVNFGGLPEIIDRYAERIAMSADIPLTRFWGKSPSGFMATGDSDMINYALHVGAMQERAFRGPLRKLDLVLSKNAGLEAPLKYKWVDLVSFSEEARAGVMEAKVRAVSEATKQKPLLTTEEGRRILSMDSVVGRLENDTATISKLEQEYKDTEMQQTQAMSREGERGVGASQNRRVR